VRTSEEQEREGFFGIWVSIRVVLWGVGCQGSVANEGLVWVWGYPWETGFGSEPLREDAGGRGDVSGPAGMLVEVDRRGAESLEWATGIEGGCVAC